MEKFSGKPSFLYAVDLGGRLSRDLLQNHGKTNVRIPPYFNAAPWKVVTYDLSVRRLRTPLKHVPTHPQRASPNPKLLETTFLNKGNLQYLGKVHTCGIPLDHPQSEHASSLIMPKSMPHHCQLRWRRRGAQKRVQRGEWTSMWRTLE